MPESNTEATELSCPLYFSFTLIYRRVYNICNLKFTLNEITKLKEGKNNITLAWPPFHPILPLPESLDLAIIFCHVCAPN